MAEKIEMLNEDELDGIVGGAFNQKAVEELGLEVRTSKSGAQSLTGKLQFGSGSLPESFSGTGSTGLVSETRLRGALENHDSVAAAVKTTSGETRVLTKSDIVKLLS